MKTLFLAKGHECFVDDEDFDALSKYHWQRQSAKKTFYATRNPLGEETHKVYMHRQILGLKLRDGLIVDHKDGNGLNNTKGNLRITNHFNNCCNRRKSVNSKTSSIYKGVFWDKERGLWRADIKIHRRLKSLGRYCSEIEAAKAYDDAAITYFGEYARLNLEQASQL